MPCPGKRSVPPEKDRNAAMKQEGMGSHWQLLDQEARIKFQEILEEHNLAHRVIARHIRQLPRMRSMGDHDVIIFLIRRFLDQTSGQATVEDAAVYLARSSWDVRIASYRWIDPENYGAMATDELWGGENNYEANLPNIHETLRSVVQKDIIQPPVVRDTSPMHEGHHKKHHKMANRYAAFASAAMSTIKSEQQVESLAGREETLDTTASSKTPNGAASPKTVKTEVTTASLNTAALTIEMDRSRALKGQVRPDKFTIVVEQPDRMPKRKKWCFPQYNKGEDFDWQNMEHIRSLNKWRSQIFRRTLGKSRPGRVPFHKEEVDWVTNQYVLHHNTALKDGVEPNYHNMNWNAIAQEFNERFEGQMLPDCDEPRPHRTKSSIQTQRYRIEAVSKLTSVPKKGGTAKIKRLAEVVPRGESPKNRTKIRRGTTGRGTYGTKTVERLTSADTANDSTTNDSNTVAGSNAIKNEEEEFRDSE